MLAVQDPLEQSQSGDQSRGWRGEAPAAVQPRWQRLSSGRAPFGPPCGTQHPAAVHRRILQPPATMLLLFESSAGFCLFKVLNEGKLKEAETQVGGRQMAPSSRGTLQTAHDGACREGPPPHACATPANRTCTPPPACRMSGATLRPPMQRRRWAPALPASACRRRRRREAAGGVAACRRQAECRCAGH
jgi:hypothetical protein